MRNKDDLRVLLDEIDSKIFDLVRQRLDVSREMADVKIASGEETCDLQRERDMIEGKVCAYSDIPSPVVRRIERALVLSGKEAQYKRRRELSYGNNAESP